MDINKQNILLCCRMCLSMVNIDEMDALTRSYNICGQKLDELVAELFNIQIKWFRCPYKLCKICRKKLEEIVEFRAKIVYTDGIFKTLVENENKEIADLNLKDVNMNANGLQDTENDEQFTELITYETTEAVLADLNLKGTRQKKPDKFRCYICKTDFIDNNSLYIHFEKDHCSLVLPYECTLCDSRAIKTISNMNKHLALHNEERPFQCKYCSLRFSLSKQLKKHEMIHQNKKPRSKLNLPHKKVKKIIEKSTIKKKVSEKTVDPARCNICKTSFESNENLQEHLVIHFGLVPYYCSICDNKLIRSTSGLNKHMALHDQDRPFVCSYCPKRFTINERLRKHEFNHREKLGLIVKKVFHNETKKHQCSICGQTFSFASNMKTHENIHTQMVKYECKCCGKNFNQAKNLKRHEQIHTGEMPYKCTVCGKGYVQSNDLKDHLTLHSGALPYKCSICQKQFRTRTLFKTHSKVHQKPVVELNTDENI